MAAKLQILWRTVWEVKFSSGLPEKIATDPGLQIFQKYIEIFIRLFNEQLLFNGQLLIPRLLWDRAIIAINTGTDSNAVIAEMLRDTYNSYKQQ